MTPDPSRTPGPGSPMPVPKEVRGYIVIHGRDGEVVGSGATLAKAVAGRESPDSLWGWHVEALVGDDLIRVPREAYSEPDPPSREEALEFIRDRAARIAKSPNPADSIWEAMGCLRCIASDPEEKQVADYVASAQWKVRTAPNEHWVVSETPGDA